MDPGTAGGPNNNININRALMSLTNRVEKGVRGKAAQAPPYDQQHNRDVYKRNVNRPLRGGWESPEANFDSRKSIPSNNVAAVDGGAAVAGGGKRRVMQRHRTMALKTPQPSPSPSFSFSRQHPDPGHPAAAIAAAAIEAAAVEPGPQSMAGELRRKAVKPAHPASRSNSEGGKSVRGEGHHSTKVRTCSRSFCHVYLPVGLLFLYILCMLACWRAAHCIEY